MRDMDEANTHRVRCPLRIVDDAGGGFAVGAIGGGIWNFYRGYTSAMAGSKLRGALDGIAARAAPTAGSFGAWAGLFAVGDCTFAYLRGKQDPWNAIMSGGVTSATLAARAGPRRALGAGVFGAITLGMIEGAIILMGRLNEAEFRPREIVLTEMPDAPLPPKKSEEPPVPAMPAGPVDLNTVG